MSDIEYRAVTPEGWPRARGYSHGVVARATTQIRIAGQIGIVPGQASVDPAADFGTQWALAMANLVAVLRAAGAEPEHIVMLRAYVADMEDFRKNGPAIGSAWSQTLGKHFPAMTLVQVSGFVDPHARVEIEGEALLP
jgi:enamine deaminase RidA (YjgF/YER057c/UK114 family)